MGITNSDSGTRIDEVTADLYRISTPVGAGHQGFSFNQFLLVDDEPLLFHTGPRAMFPLTLEAIRTVLPPEKLRHVAFSHLEADECGALNDLLRVAPTATPLCSRIAKMVSADDIADRPARALADGERLVLGKHTVRWLDAPHLPHGWDCGYLFDETTRTLLCGDLFTQPGAEHAPLTTGDILGPSEAMRAGLDYFAHGRDTPALLEKLAATEPQTLACMHGSSWQGDGAKLVRQLAATLAVALLVAACGGDDDDADAAPGDYFSEAPWLDDISGAAPASDSAAVIAALDAAGGWGNSGRFQIDFSMHVLAGDDAPTMEFETTDDFYTPDCDHVPVPVPDGGAIEGEEAYACASDGDCHLLVVRERRLYEMWRANIAGGTFLGGCLAVWDLSRPWAGRGEQCTSADAAGLPIAPLLFTADEVAAGSIDHAIRFILPNERIRAAAYVAPATHGTPATSGGPAAPPYGARFRLRADYPVDDLPSPGARVVARALQKHGMFLADAGQIALTGQNDRFTTAKWEGLLEPQDLAALEVTDFELMPHTTPVPLTLDCTRTPLAE